MWLLKAKIPWPVGMAIVIAGALWGCVYASSPARVMDETVQELRQLNCQHYHLQCP